MPRIHILPNVTKVSKPGTDPRTATFDNLLLSTDYITDQVLLTGVLAFGSGNSVTLSLPSANKYKFDFFYCVLSGSTVTQILWPANRLMRIEVGGSQNGRSQVFTAQFSGSSLIFRRRGQIAGQANRGALYVIYNNII